MSATSKLALVKPRFSVSRRAKSIAVGERSSPTVVSTLSEKQRDGGLPAAHVQHVAVKPVGLDQRDKLGLGFSKAHGGRTLSPIWADSPR